MQKLFALTLISLFLLFANAEAQKLTKANVTIILQTKEGNPIANQNFEIRDDSENLVLKGKTNENGVFKCRLKKGAVYFIVFSQETKNWRFSLEIPNKPGPRSYKFRYKIKFYRTSTLVYKAKNKNDSTRSKYCLTTVKIRDEAGMALPNQPFKIYDIYKEFSRVDSTNDSGVCVLKLPKGKAYQLETKVDGETFYSSFEISIASDIFDYNFNINFTKTSTLVYDTVYKEIYEREPGVLKGIFIVEDQNKKPVANCDLILEESNRRYFAAKTDENGKADTLVDRRKVYDLFARKFGKTFHYEVIPPKDKTLTEFTFIVKVNFDFKPKRKFTLKVYFDSGKYNLRKDSYPALEQLYQTLKANPNMVIEIQGHTDSIGSAKSNQILSENRAKTCRNYLLKRGISKDRIFAKGYGETRPVATNKTPQGRQLNRRIDVAVLAE